MHPDLNHPSKAALLTALWYFYQFQMVVLVIILIQLAQKENEKNNKEIILMKK